MQFWGLDRRVPRSAGLAFATVWQWVPNNNINYGQNSSSNASQQQKIQQQLNDADANLQSAARLRSYQQAEQQIVNDVGWLPIEQVTTTFLRSPNIVGIADNAQSIIPPDDWANIYRVQPASS